MFTWRVEMDGAGLLMAVTLQPDDIYGGLALPARQCRFCYDFLTFSTPTFVCDSGSQSIFCS
jgi:hypothetical protein